jgi:hypothetical protein
MTKWTSPSGFIRSNSFAFAFFFLINAGVATADEVCYPGHSGHYRDLGEHHARLRSEM